MDLLQVLEVAAAIIVSMGGSGAIVIGISKFFGQSWADKVLEKEKAKYGKELELYRNELKKELDKISALQSKALHISKIQYDNEYRIYQEIWLKLHECKIASLLLYPRGIENVPSDKKEHEDYQFGKLKTYTQAYNTYATMIEINAPFYKEEFYNDFIQLRDYCHELGAIFRHYEVERKYNLSFASVRDVSMSSEEANKVYIEIPDKIDEVYEKLKKAVRKYLHDLQLTE